MEKATEEEKAIWEKTMKPLRITDAIKNESSQTKVKQNKTNPSSQQMI